MPPTSAIVAVTLNCNARCTMCDIWQNRMTDEMSAEEYTNLPPSLQDINVSGGEPFLREDLSDVIYNMRTACPKARFVISTNGFLPERTAKTVQRILSFLPDLAVRVSIDGLEAVHDEVRGIQGGFAKCLRTLEELRDMGITDLGIGFTILERNLAELPKIHHFSRQHNLQLSVSIATDSPIFFGMDKESLRPRSTPKLCKHLSALSATEYRQFIPKSWFRGWYAQSLGEYARTGIRPLSCDAGSGFFYLDSLGNVFGCHLLPNKMGNLREHSWSEIWNSPTSAEIRDQAATCHACWMVCTSKSAVRKNLPLLALQMATGKLKSHMVKNDWG